MRVHPDSPTQRRIDDASSSERDEEGSASRGVAGVLTIGLATCALIFLHFSTSSNLFMLLFLAVGIVLVFASAASSATAYLIMFTSFAEVIRVSFTGVYLYPLLMASYVLGHVLVRRGKVPAGAVLAYLIFVVYVASTYDTSNASVYAESTLVIASYALLIPLASSFHRADFRLFVLAFTSSVLMAGVLGSLRSELPRLDRVLRTNEVLIDWVAFSRFIGLSLDANYFALSCALAIALVLCIQLHWAVKLVLLASLGWFGLMTFSKMFLVLLAVVLILYVLLDLRLHPVKTSRLVVLLAAGYLLVERVSHGLVTQVFHYRFADGSLESGMEANSLNGLTTGRTDLQAMYLGYLWRNTRVLFFGASLGNEDLNGAAAHNTLIQMVYVFGLLGSLLFLLYLHRVRKTLNDTPTLRRWTSYQVAPTVIFIFASFSLSLISFSTTYVPIFLCLSSVTQGRSLRKSSCSGEVGV